MEAQSSAPSPGQLVHQNSREIKDMKLPKITVHTIRKPQTKPWRKPTAPLPAATQVYKVDRMDFKDVVQSLTGAPKFQTQPRLCRQRSAVSPLDMAKPTLTMGERNMVSQQEFIPIVSNSVFPGMSQDLMSESVDITAQRNSDDKMVESFLEMNSPTMHNWVPLLSPRSLLSHLQ